MEIGVGAQHPAPLPPEVWKGRKPDSVLIAIYLMRPVPAAPMVRAKPRRLFGLAPDGVFRAAGIAADAVGSYPAFSPLPRRACARRGGMFSVALVRPPVITTESLHLRGASRPVESGLSSPPRLRETERLSALPNYQKSDRRPVTLSANIECARSSRNWSIRRRSCCGCR